MLLNLCSNLLLRVEYRFQINICVQIWHRHLHDWQYNAEYANTSLLSSTSREKSHENAEAQINVLAIKIQQWNYGLMRALKKREKLCGFLVPAVISMPNRGVWKASWMSFRINIHVVRAENLVPAQNGMVLKWRLIRFESKRDREKEVGGWKTFCVSFRKLRGRKTLKAHWIRTNCGNCCVF